MLFHVAILSLYIFGCNGQIVLGYPGPMRPPYRPNPTYELISQLIQPGQPWPSNAAGYEMFSQTKFPPNYTPSWATTIAPRPANLGDRTTKSTTTPRSVNSQGTVTTRATTLKPINIEDRIKETEKPPEYGWYWPSGDELFPNKRVMLENKIRPTNEDRKTTTSPATSTKSTTEESMKLFTSAPVQTDVKIDFEEPKVTNVGVANLLPSKVIVHQRYGNHDPKVENVGVANLLPSKQRYGDHSPTMPHHNYSHYPIYKK